MDAYGVQFTQKILNHHSDAGSKRYIDQLEKYTYKSDPETSLASLFLQKLAALCVPQDKEFPTAVAIILLGLWAQCLDEKQVRSIRMLMSINN